jgi:hypothetical protein
VLYLLSGAAINAIVVRTGAHLQNEAVHALCRQVRHFGSRAVPGNRGCGTRIDCRRSRWWRNKQRIARHGQGKSAGFRTLIVFRAGVRAFFVHGFAKSEKDNVEKDELVALKKLAAELLAYDDKTIARVIATGTLEEVACDEKTIS